MRPIIKTLIISSALSNSMLKSGLEVYFLQLLLLLLKSGQLPHSLPHHFMLSFSVGPVLERELPCFWLWLFHFRFPFYHFPIFIMNMLFLND